VLYEFLLIFLIHKVVTFLVVIIFEMKSGKMEKNFIYFFLFFSLIVTLSVIIQVKTCWSELKVKRLNPEGELYRIAEKDALKEIEEKIRSLDIKKLEKRIAASINKKLVFKSEFPHACKNATYSFIPWYVLNVDIKNEKGEVIYPKGYTFNPLDYIPFPFVFVFFDGGSRVEVEWVKKNFKNAGGSVFLVATGGSLFELVKELERPVYKLTPELKERFQIRKTPTVAKAVNKTIIVQEIGVHKCQ
jgi:hypothetical protein